MISVGTAAPGDRENLLALVRSLAEHHSLLDQVEANAAALEAALFAADAFVGCFIAEADGRAAGYAFWHRSFTTFRGREVLISRTSASSPNSAGAKSAKLQAVAKLAVAREYPGIYWLMMEWNTGARAFYERLGAVGELGLVYWRLKDEALRRAASR